jgi:hypothetical protein
MRGAVLIAAAKLLGLCAALGSLGCAAVFRDGKSPVRVESDPAGASVQAKEAEGATPLVVPVPRSGITELRVTMPGFEEHHGLVRKRVNGWWLTLDLATCIVPVMLCVPLFVDAVSGAWYDVDEKYRARLLPLGTALIPSYGADGSVYVMRRPTTASTTATATTATAAVATAPGPAPAAAPGLTSAMSDSERKASARAAYQEGMELQAQKSPDALARFQYAQRLFDAPTHLLHIAECLVVSGKLVEAQETYETLTHRELPADAPAPFREAVETGKRELADLQPRIPTLRIEVKPSPSTLRNLTLSLNGRPVSNEVIGIARPVNPGAYRITATAWGIPPSKEVNVTLAEKDARSVEVKLGR